MYPAGLPAAARRSRSAHGTAAEVHIRPQRPTGRFPGLAGADRGTATTYTTSRVTPRTASVGSIPRRSAIPGNGTDQRANQSAKVALVQSDQSVQIVRKNRAVLPTRTARPRNEKAAPPRVRFRVCFASQREFASTRPAKIVQNVTSTAVSRNVPRSQNHCQACRNQVTAKTARVEITSPGVAPSRFARK